MSRFARSSAAALLAGAVLVGGGAGAVFADPQDGEPTEQEQGTAEETQDETGGAPTGGEDDGADVGDGATDAPADVQDGLRYVSGFVANGRAAGPTTFTPVLGDEQYPVPAPPENENLPADVDVQGAYTWQASCDPVDRPGVTAFALLLTEHYGRPAFSGSRPCVEYNSDHHEGRGLDWALSAHDPMERRIADTTIQWLVENDGEMAARFGISNIIWNSQVWKPEYGWQVYVGHPHDDHIHFSFNWDGAQMRTSWWTGVATTRADLGPCRVDWKYGAVHRAPRFEECAPNAAVPPASGLATVKPDGQGAGVSLVQDTLGLPVTGTLDRDTREALLDWQAEHDVPATGMADDYTYAALQGQDLGELPENLFAVFPEEWQTTEFTPYLRDTVTVGDTGPAVEVLQTALGAEVDGVFGPETAGLLAEWEETVPVLAIQASRRGEEPAAVTPLTWLMLERAAHPTLPYRDAPLAVGSRDRAADPEGLRAAEEPDPEIVGALTPYAGGAVTVLQELLGIDADGIYGELTAEAVAEAQTEAGLEPTGEVDGPTWAAIEEIARDAERIPAAPGADADDEAEGADSTAAPDETDAVSTVVPER